MIMKNFLLFYLCSLPLLGILMGVLSGCTDDPQQDVGDASATLNVSSVTASTAELVLTAKGISEFAYIVSDEADASSDENVLFAKGTVVASKDGDNAFSVTGLNPNTKYSVNVALKVTEGKFYGEVLHASFTTSDFTESLTLMGTTDDGFTVHVKFPQEVIDRKQVIRWNVANLVMYNSNKMGFMASLDAEMLEANGQQYLTKDSTITYSDDNINLRDKNGNEILDDLGEPIQLHEPYVPGEPLIFLAGEFGWGEATYGWGEGWYKAMFDFDKYWAEADDMGGGGILLDETVSKEEDYWTGFFGKLEFQTTAPEKSNAKLNISVDAKPTKATLKITPDEGILQYCWLVLDHASYESMLLPMLSNKEEYLQWFTTSYYAAMTIGAQTNSGPIEVALENNYYLEPDVEYHVLVTGMEDEQGMKQCFEHFKFTTPQKSLAAPVVEVKPISNPSGKENPFEVWFNVKAPNKDLESAMYACNYKRDFASALANGMNYSDIVPQGNKFTAENVAQINTEKGMDVSFSSMDDAITVLAVMGYNEENTPNDVDGENSPAVAENRTIKRPHLDKVDSPLFAELKGEWTASMKVSKFDYASQEEVPVPDPMKVKVTVYPDGVTYPETLPSDVYELYPDMSKEQVDALYDEFKQEAKEYNEKVKGQNSILCLGFAPGYDTATPYELFTSKTYSGYDNESLFYDFGPKWYLQVAKDGSVSVPVNDFYMFPASAWYKSILYMIALGDQGYVTKNSDGSSLSFPVVVLDDMNTITWRPIVDETYGALYPNLAYRQYGNSMSLGSEYRIISDITITKGWEGGEETPAVSKISPMDFPALNGEVKAIDGCHLRKTPMKALVNYKKVSANVVTKDSFEKGFKEFFANKKYAK